MFARLRQHLPAIRRRAQATDDDNAANKRTVLSWPAGLLARRIPPSEAGTRVPAGYLGLRSAASRLPAGQELQSGDWLLAPGPHALQMPLLADWPELGIALQIAADTPEPRLPQQRLELYLQDLAQSGHSELTLQRLQDDLAACLQHAWQQGRLQLPTCASAQEWQACRAWLQKTLYLRFGWLLHDWRPCELAAGQAQARRECDLRQQAMAQHAAMPAAAPIAPTAPIAEEPAPQQLPAAPDAPAIHAAVHVPVHAPVPTSAQGPATAVAPAGAQTQAGTGSRLQAQGCAPTSADNNAANNTSNNNSHSAPDTAALAARLWRELPALCQAWRALPLSGPLFRQRQALLQAASLLEAQAGLPRADWRGQDGSQGWRWLDQCQAELRQLHRASEPQHAAQLSAALSTWQQAQQHWQTVLQGAAQSSPQSTMRTVASQGVNT